ncbi:hypothetical protein BD410DRAFT_780893 [Rickenella mellea]|uniref:Chromatin-remodeling ATPase INO80 n=1 Tax=Rickenella mellea TaxID=50990 RepID=A0A4Y7QMW2_9AGAM|nr:hypothetical protein BD410DRAFT_780893 [Rickenella mellea]
MSLSRILNNTPSSPLPTIQPQLHAPVPVQSIDPALMEISRRPSPTSSYAPHPDITHEFLDTSPTPPQDHYTASISPELWQGGPNSTHPSENRRDPLAEHPPPPPRGLAYQPQPWQGAGGYNPYTHEWTSGDIFPLGSGDKNYYPDEAARPQSTSLRTHSRTASHYKDENMDSSTSASTSRKRRKTNDDPDYQPSRRYPTRRNPPRAKLNQQGQQLEFVEPEPPVEEPKPSAEELRLMSSDLSDCEEVWIAELGEYILETQKRQRQVEYYFEESCVIRNSEAARKMSKKYASRIASIPPPVRPRPMRRIQSGEEDVMRSFNASPTSEFQASNELGLDLGGQASPSQSYIHDYAAGAEDAARELEDNVLGAPHDHERHSRGAKKREAAALSDASSDFEVPAISKRDQDGLATKKRKLDSEMDDITDELERSIATDKVAPALTGKKGGRGRGKGATPILSGVSLDGAKVRKRPGPRKKGELFSLKGHDLLGPPSVSGSLAGDVTPTPSVPASPALSANVVYELTDAVPPLKRAKKVDEAAMLKRVLALEEAQRKVWVNIARKDVVKVYKVHILGYQARQNQCKRIAAVASVQGKKPSLRTTKTAKEVQAKAKRLMKEMMVFWKKNEREERDVRKRAEKEAVDRAKEEEERREAARQARKLEFLISQTELYSHFVGNKLKTAEVEGESSKTDTPAGALVTDVDGHLADINFDDDDQTNLHRHARRNAQEAITLAKQRALQFDTEAALERKTKEAVALAKAQAHVRDDDDDDDKEMSESAPLVDLDSDELNFQNPTSLTGPLTVAQPRMLMAQLKEYQLKGLNWLSTLYEQGINGILADEMGLGKTVQSISLLAYLAETHDIWGPFLVVAPASTLHNWQQEITRFVPKLKALPYWGNVKDRATLRKFWSKKEISYNQDAPFHVLITSYQLVTQDQQYFQRVKWQYMILDEAQNIKNSSSVRWKTLLGFQCRNRLLLTGTPIQNNMQELWALLHFIMPSLFDSHDEFSEWFSKDIENAAAENKGSKLNEHQLRRLHMILKPFMLRRVKRHVQNELSDKIEVDIFVDLSARQRALYRALRANVSVADLLEKAANIGDADAARSLMNLVMQFRKVCNHPELFERADVVAPFSFCEFGRSGPINREGDFIYCNYSTRNPLEFKIPELFYLDGGIRSVPQENSPSGPNSEVLRKLTSIWTTDWMRRSLEDDVKSPFAFLQLLDMGSGDAHTLHFAPTIFRLLHGVAEDARRKERDPYALDSDFAAFSLRETYRVSTPSSLLHLEVAESYPALHDVAISQWKQSCLSRPGLRWFVPPAVAPPPAMYCADRTFMECQTQLLDAPLESLALYGLPTSLKEDSGSCDMLRTMLPNIPPSGLVGSSSPDQLLASPMQVPEAKRLIYDSGKLARLDALLHELKAGDHRVLVYFQMTRMMDLMEEYLIYRQYKYLRLDGSSKLEDRRDMVIDWQTRPDIFVFLLSTRAGGLGINLTAADTVVFYDHDWNPSNDAQAMDRAHRLGQTRQVTVYRLITKGTIDERIVQLARVKKDVQDIVVGNKQFTDVAKPNEIVSLLLNDDELANLQQNQASSNGASSSKGNKGSGQPTDETSAAVRDLWTEEGDYFFGHNAGSGPAASNDDGEDEDLTPTPPIAASNRGKRKRAGVGLSTRGRKVVGGKGTKRKAAGDTLPDDF